MIATSYLGSGMNSAFRNKNNFPSHPFPMFSEAVLCIHLEKETSSSSFILFRFILKEEKSYPLWVSNKSHLELWLLRALCGWVRTTICYLGREARIKQPQEPLRSQHLSRTDTANTSKHYLTLTGKFQKKTNYPQCYLPCSPLAFSKVLKERFFYQNVAFI